MRQVEIVRANRSNTSGCYSQTDMLDHDIVIYRGGSIM